MISEELRAIRDELEGHRKWCPKSGRELQPRCGACSGGTVERLLAEVERLQGHDAALLSVLMALYHSEMCDRSHNPLVECPRFDVWLAGSLPDDVEPWPESSRHTGPELAAKIAKFNGE